MMAALVPWWFKIFSSGFDLGLLPDFSFHNFSVSAFSNVLDPKRMLHLLLKDPA
jgi:hypothetical protein